MTSPAYKIQDSYQFATSNGLQAEARSIQDMRIHPDAGKPAVVRKGYLVDLFESRGIMQEFVNQYWPTFNTPSGQTKRSYYLNKKTLNERLLQEGSLGEDEEDPEGLQDSPRADEESSFSLEAQLRDFIAENLHRIPVTGRRLTLYRDEAGNTGVEYPTGVGPIDILAVDDSRNFIVFELKLERGPDRALGQLARYMGWVKMHLAGEHLVCGIIVAKTIDERLKYAVQVFPGVSLLEYEVQFSLREANLAQRSEN